MSWGGKTKQEEHEGKMKVQTRRLFTLTFAVAATALLLLRPSPASAGNCLQDEYALTARQKLNCTANDVRVAKVTNVRDLSGNPLTSCISGSTFNFIADFTVVTSSTSSRSNIGLYFATAGGQSTALTGQCSDNIIPPSSYTCPGSTVTCQTSTHDEFDASPDNCGDTSSSDPSATQVVTIEVDNFSCQAPAGTTSLVLPNCTSWQVPGSTIQCVSPGPDFPYPFDTSGKPEAIPGSPSKCNCATIPLPITVQSPMATVSKSCTTAQSSGLNTSCTLAPEGGTVTYTVGVTNTSNFGNIVVDQICDSAYGNIFTAASFTGPACPAGTAGTDTGTTCSALTIAANSSQTCTFTANQPENKTVTDTVSVSGHGSSAGNFGPTLSNPVVSVASGEAPSTATITKSLVSTTAGCATVRYGVDIKNTSSADEVLSLSALSDSSYGSITTDHGSGNGSVVGTTCGLATGIGTLAGTGAGAFPATLAVGGSDYTCQFDATFCGPIAPVTLPGGTTCNGISNMDTVTGTLTGDEGEVVSTTANTLTVDECFTTFSSSTTP